MKYTTLYKILVLSKTNNISMSFYSALYKIALTEICWVPRQLSIAPMVQQFEYGATLQLVIFKILIPSQGFCGFCQTTN